MVFTPLLFVHGVLSSQEARERSKNIVFTSEASDRVYCTGKRLKNDRNLLLQQEFQEIFFGENLDLGVKTIAWVNPHSLKNFEYQPWDCGNPTVQEWYESRLAEHSIADLGNNIRVNLGKGGRV